VKKNGGQEAQALGRSRGGFSTKIHLGCLDERTGVAIVITAGACHDAPLFETVFEQLPDEHELDHGVMDKGYDSDKIRNKLREEDMEPVIPPRTNRNEQYAYDKDIYKLRNKVERFMNRLKQFRRIATRYEKLTITFLGLMHLVAVYVAIH
jgi:transposase